jgi:phospholipase/carboxylesterase
MPVTTKTRRPIRHTEGFTTTCLRVHPDRPVRMFLPSDYQPKYAYPLVILFHADGADEDSAARLAPLLSRRNYVVACPRGPVALGSGSAGRPGFAWSDASKDAYLADVLTHTRDKYHIHSQRLYLVGVGEGAAVAYRFGLGLADAVGGVVALNGELPLGRKKAPRGMQMFVGHGVNNPVVPVAVARRSSRLLTAAGTNVQFQTYSTTDRINPDMLRDVNRWIMSTVNAGPEWLATANA